MEETLHTLKFLEKIGNAVVEGLKTGSKGEFSDTELYNILQFAQNSLLNNGEQMRKQIAYNVGHNCTTLADIAYLLNKYIDLYNEAGTISNNTTTTVDNDNNKPYYTITVDDKPIKTLPYYKIHEASYNNYDEPIATAPYYQVPYDKYDDDDKALMDFLETIV